MAEKNFFKRLIKKLRVRFRLVIMNDSTFEEKFSLKLSRLNVFVVSALISIFLITLTVFLIAFTSLREYIPGYGSEKEREIVYELLLKSDSIESDLNAIDVYLKNFFTTIADDDSSLLVSNYLAFSGNKSTEISENKNAAGLYFLKPINGNILNPFNLNSKHFGIDIIAEKGSVVNSIADGIVLFSDWTLSGGNTLIILHPGKVISVYMHNFSVFVKQGESVKTGDPIAIIGNSGENSSGTHLHFELWINSLPVNPENYISF
jgi:murein DD-endopeptidase MepM/ murein hydrolase activator NlpD